MKLIIINGSCGAGKSTLAKKIHEQIPMSVLIGVDDLRKNIAHYRENRLESGFLSFELALGIMEKAFENGRDVIFERLMFGYSKSPKDYLSEYFALAKKYNVDIYEIILVAEKDTVINRIKSREKGELLTIENAEIYYDEMEKFIPKREDAHIIDTENTTENEVFEIAWKEINKN